MGLMKSLYSERSFSKVKKYPAKIKNNKKSTKVKSINILENEIEIDVLSTNVKNTKNRKKKIKYRINKIHSWQKSKKKLDEDYIYSPYTQSYHAYKRG